MVDDEERTLLTDEKVQAGCDAAGSDRHVARQGSRRSLIRRSISYLQSETMIENFEAKFADWVQSISWRSCATRVANIFAPSFCREPSEHRKIRGTEWLDGLRGLAAWWVMNSHIASILVKWSGAGYGADDGSGAVRTEFFMLPYVRLVFSGQFSVYIFFIISGMAISLSPVSRMSREDISNATLISASSSALRRPVRLFLPAMASMVFSFAFVRLGLIEMAYSVFQKSWVLDGWDSRWTQFPSSAERSLLDQMLDLLRETLKLFDVVKPDQSVPAYNPVLWTIVVEYRASLMLYLMHLAVFHLRRRYRIILPILIMGLTIALGYLYEVLFIYGYIMTEVTSYRNSKQSPCVSRPWKTGLWCLIAVVALWLASMPGFMPQYAPFYSTLGSFNPLGIDEAGHAWHRIAAMLLFTSLCYEPLLQWAFITKFGRYMGRISFSLYLVHLPIVTTLGTVMFDAVLSKGGNASIPPIVSFLGAYVAVTIPIIYIADRFEELIDQPSIRFGRHLENLMMRGDSG